MRNDLFGFKVSQFDINNPSQNHVSSRRLPGDPFWDVDFMRSCSTLGPLQNPVGAQMDTQNRPSSAKQISVFTFSTRYRATYIWAAGAMIKQEERVRAVRGRKAAGAYKKGVNL